MKIYDFTIPELDYFRKHCNFADEEMVLFEHRAKSVPLERCAELMSVSVSTAKRISQRVNSKIVRVSAWACRQDFFQGVKNGTNSF